MAYDTTLIGQSWEYARTTGKYWMLPLFVLVAIVGFLTRRAVRE